MKVHERKSSHKARRNEYDIDAIQEDCTEEVPGVPMASRYANKGKRPQQLRILGFILEIC